jgi:hypothetical protein
MIGGTQMRMMKPKIMIDYTVKTLKYLEILVARELRRRTTEYGC